MIKNKLPDFISKQVRESKYFFLDLKVEPEIELFTVCGGREICKPEYVINRSGFAYFAIEFVAEGQGIFQVKDRQYQLEKGSIFGYQPGAVHKIISNKNAPMVKYFVDFTGEQANQVLQQLQLTEGKPMQLGPTYWVCNIFDQMIETGTRTAPQAKAHCNLLLKLLASRMTLDAKVQTNYDTLAYRTFCRCRQFAENNFLKLHTTEQWAKSCRIDPSYLSRIFKRFSLQKPYQFLLQLKMNHATMLMVHHGALVNQAAAAVGFFDPNQFSRVFKRVNGVSPTKYVNEMNL